MAQLTAILVWDAQWTFFYDGISGDSRWRMRLRNSSQPAPGKTTPTDHLLALSALSQCLAVPGHTSHWTVSEGNTVILTIIDQFSKAVHFVPLPKLPSASETTNSYPCLLSPRHPTWHRLWQGSSVHLWRLEGFLSGTGDIGESLLVSTHRLTGRLSEQINIWNPPSVVWWPPIRLLGVLIFLGLSMHITSCYSPARLVVEEGRNIKIKVKIIQQIK